MKAVLHPEQVASSSQGHKERQAAIHTHASICRHTFMYPQRTQADTCRTFKLHTERFWVRIYLVDVLLSGHKTDYSTTVLTSISFRLTKLYLSIH